jgi:hypothetical protein
MAQDPKERRTHFAITAGLVLIVEFAAVLGKEASEAYTVAFLIGQKP